MQQATDLANDAFWAAMEELDLKVSGGKLLVESTGRQRSVKNRMCDLFLGRVSERELTARAPLEWRGTESFAALFWRIWLLRCRDAMRRTIQLTQNGEEEELAGDLPTGEMVILAKEKWGEMVAQARKNLQKCVTALEQVTEQLRKQRNLKLAAVGDTLLRFVREQLHEAQLDGVPPAFEEAAAWEFVQHTLGLNRDAAYQRKSRFLKAVKDSPQASVLLEYLQKPEHDKG